MFTKNKKLFSLVIVTLLVAAGGALVYKTYQSRNKAPEAAVLQQENGQSVRFAPTTEAEKKETDAHKQAIAESNSGASDQQPGPGAKTVTPIITYAGQSNAQVEIDAYVPGIAEDGGTCQVVATNNGKTQTAASSAIANSATTNCPAIFINTSTLGTGTWSVKVTYSSSSASGTSAAQNITVK